MPTTDNGAGGAGGQIDFDLDARGVDAGGGGAGGQSFGARGAGGEATDPDRTEIRAKMEQQAQAMADRRAKLEADPEVQALRAKARQRAENEMFREQVGDVIPLASMPHSVLAEPLASYQPGEEPEPQQVLNPEAAEAAMALTITTAREGEPEAVMAKRAQTIFKNYHKIQEALLDTDGDLERLEAEYPEVYGLIGPTYTDATSPEERRAAAQRELLNERLTLAWKEGFTPNLSAAEKKAASIRMARELGVNPTMVYENFDDLQRTMYALNFDPEALRRNRPDLWLMFTHDPRTGSIGLFDPTLKRPGAVMGAIHEAADVLVFSLPAAATDAFASILRLPGALAELAAGLVYEKTGMDPSEAAWLLREQRRVTDYTPLHVLGNFLAEAAEEARWARSIGSIYAAQKSAPGGSIADPSSWSLGDDPSLWGYTVLTAEAFGSVIPMLVGTGLLGSAAKAAGASVGGRVAANLAIPSRLAIPASRAAQSVVTNAPMAVVGAMQVGGGAVREIEDTITALKEAPGGLYANVPAYQKLVDAGLTPEAAEEAIRQDALRYVLPMALGVGGLGGFASSIVFNSPSLLSSATRRLWLKYGSETGVKGVTKGTAQDVLSRLPQAGLLRSFGRVAGRIVVGAGEEGTEEVVESTVITGGLNIALGLDRPLLDGTFGDFILALGPGGALGGTGALRAEAALFRLRGSMHIAQALNNTERQAAISQLGEAVGKAIGHVATGETATANPEAVADVVRQQVRDTIAKATGMNPDEVQSIDTIYVAADALVDAYGEEGAADAAAKLLNVEDGAAALSELRESGRRLEVPLETFVEHLNQNKAQAEAILEGSTPFEDALTPRELQAYRDEITAEKEAVLAADSMPEGEDAEGVRAASSVADAESETSEHRFVQAAKEFLKDRMPERDIRAHLAMWRARIRVAARRSGVDPELVFRDLELGLREHPSTTLDPSAFDPRMPKKARQRFAGQLKGKKVRGLFYQYRNILGLILTPAATRATFAHESAHFFFSLLEYQAEQARKQGIPDDATMARAKREVEEAREVARDLRESIREAEADLANADPKGRIDLERRIAEQKALLAQAQARVDALTKERDELATRYAQRQIIADYEAALRWLNPEGGPLTAAHLEKWAEAWEAYLADGKASSPALAGMFRRYQRLMTDVYGEADNIFRSSQGAWVDADGNPVEAGVSPEIREVFDRLLATDRELELMKLALGDISIFTTRRSMEKALGRPVSAEEWYAHLKDRERAQAKIARKAYQKIRESQLQEDEAWYKEKKAAYVAEALEEYERLPERVMRLRLQGLVYVDGQVVESGDGGISLDHDAVVAAVGPEAAKRFRTRKEGGVHPNDLVADGSFANGAELLMRIVELPAKRTWANERAERRMKAEHPDLLSDIDSLRAEIADLIRSNDGMTTLLTEIRTLARGLAEVDGDVLIEARKEAAADMVARTPIGQLNRKRLRAIMRTEQALGDQALKAAANGEGHLALNKFLQQLLNRHLFRYTEQAAVRVAKFRTDVNRLLRRSVRERLGRVRAEGDPTNIAQLGEVLGDGVDVLLESLGFKDPPVTLDRERSSVRDALDRLSQFKGALIADGDVLSRIVLEGKSWEDLTVAEMEEVHNFLRAALAVSRAPSTVTNFFTQQQDDINQAAEKFANEVAAENDPRDPRKTNEGNMAKLRRFLQHVHSYLVNQETLLILAAGGLDPRSAAHSYIIGAIQQGKQSTYQWQQKILPELEKAHARITPDMRKRWAEKIDARDLFPEHVSDYVPETVKDLVMLALYTGSSENLGVLLDGRGISEDQILAAINKHLKREDMEFVQAVWDAFSTTWEASRDVHRKDVGVDPKKMEARKVVTDHGTFRGGYFPAMYEWDAHDEGDLRHRPRDLEDMLGTNYIPVGTPHGYLKQRVPGFKGIVSTRFENLTRHANYVAHDLGYRLPIKSVARFLLHPKVASTFERYIGDHHYQQMLQWVRDIGRAGYSGQTIHTKKLDDVLRVLRRNLARAALGYRMTTAIADFQNILLPVISLGLDASALADALGRHVSNPKQMHEWVKSKSPEVQLQIDAYKNRLTREFQAIDKNWGPGRKGVAVALDNSFFFLEQVQKMVAPIVFTAAYNQALQGETRRYAELADKALALEQEAETLLAPDSITEEDQKQADALRQQAANLRAEAADVEANADRTAVLTAESMVRRSFPTHNVADQAAVLRSFGSVGAHVFFYSFFSTMYQQSSHMVDPFLKARGLEAKTGAFMQMALRFAAHAFVANVLGEFLMGRGPAMGDGESPEERYVAWALRKAIVAPILTVPFGSDAAYLIESRIEGKFVTGSAGLISGAFENVGRAFTAALNDRADVTAQRKFFSVARSTGYLLGIPVTPMNAAEYVVTPAWDDATMNVVEGLLLGRRNLDHGANLFTLGRMDRDPTGERARAKEMETRRLRNAPAARRKQAENRRRQRERQIRRLREQQQNRSAQ